ncbi:MAG: hypothetical protein JWR80_2556 [Bradyrhizobium sp.]|nr:hypothetical protein [Bradyrhizobium sp.]
MIGFPLLLIPLAIYNIIAFLMRDVSFAAPLFTLPLPSGTGWPVTLTDGLLTLGILMLLCEVIKGARPGAKYLTDHLLSLLVFGGAAAEFVLLPQFGTSTFFLLTLLSLVDFLSGIALRRRRGAPAMSRRDARKAEAAVPESQFEPVSTPAPAAEAEPLDRAEPKIVHPDVTPTASSPEVPSPGLQPGDGSHPSPDRPR